MNNEYDYSNLSEKHLNEILADSLEMENELMRRYLIAAERIHNNQELVERLRNFAEGNAKRSRQLLTEIQQLKQ
jgi:hypothetical protein